MQLQIIRAAEFCQKAGAYSVRIQAMGRQYNIPLDIEFDEHDNADAQYVRVLDDGYPVATCRFYELSNTTVLIGRVVVLPEYQGKGIGRMMIQFAEKWIAELGYARINIDARVEKTGFYEKLGYSGDMTNVIYGEIFNCVPMHKNLQP